MEKTIQEFTITSGNREAIGFTRNTEELVIPEFFVGNGNNGTVKGQTYQVTEIGRKAFQQEDCLRSVYVPSSVRKIGNLAFFMCTSLKKVHLPENLEVLPFGVFSDCSLLTEIALPRTLKIIAELSFHNCPSLKEVAFPETLQKIASGAFSYTGLSTVTFPPALEIIENEAFYETPLEHVETAFATQLKEIGERAFCKCPLKKIIIPASVKEIGAIAFDPSLKKLEISSENKTFQLICNQKVLFDVQKQELLWIQKGTTELVFPETITQINGSFILADHHFSMKTVFIPHSIASFCADIFFYTKNADLVIDKPKDSIPGSPWGTVNSNIYWIG